MIQIKYLIELIKHVDIILLLFKWKYIKMVVRFLDAFPRRFSIVSSLWQIIHARPYIPHSLFFIGVVFSNLILFSAMSVDNSISSPVDTKSVRSWQGGSFRSMSKRWSVIRRRLLDIGRLWMPRGPVSAICFPWELFWLFIRGAPLWLLSPGFLGCSPVDGRERDGLWPLFVEGPPMGVLWTHFFKAGGCVDSKERWWCQAGRICVWRWAWRERIGRQPALLRRTRHWYLPRARDIGNLVCNLWCIPVSFQHPGRAHLYVELVVVKIQYLVGSHPGQLSFRRCLTLVPYSSLWVPYTGPSKSSVQHSSLENFEMKVWLVRGFQLDFPISKAVRGWHKSNVFLQES